VCTEQLVVSRKLMCLKGSDGAWTNSNLAREKVASACCINGSVARQAPSLDIV
jgi:hypothetical protein